MKTTAGGMVQLVRVETFNLRHASDSHIRQASRVVTFDGLTMPFMERIPAREAIRQGLRHIAANDRVIGAR
jgi:hypothetical protein